MNTKNLRLKNGVYRFMEIPRTVLTTRGELSKDYWTDEIWDDLFSIGGDGSLVERMVLKYLINECGYTNIKTMPNKSSAWDFELKNDTDWRIEIRRTGKDDLNLGHTSGGKLSKQHWTRKAKKLRLGGYLIAKIQISKMVLYYAGARFLLDSKLECGNKPALLKLENRYAGFDGLTDTD